MRVLLTGGTGYIGSHTTIALIEAGHDVTLLDNFSNSKPAVLDRLHQITGRVMDFFEADVTDAAALGEIMKQRSFDAAIHFAAPKDVEDSISNPLRYYEVGVGGTIALCRALADHGVRRMVFSSTAAVYGLAEQLPVTEESNVDILSPYGRAKLICEQMLQDLQQSDGRWGIIAFRYFNAVGAHPSGLIGEAPHGKPSNLVPVIGEVALGRRGYLDVFGNDYSTPDGTGLRDFVHVMDLAEAHVVAAAHLLDNPGFEMMNLGTGRGVTVSEMVEAFSRAIGRDIPTKISSRRAGDIPASYADVTKAAEILGWRATRTLDEMCADTWRWQSKNPNGYDV